MSMLTRLIATVLAIASATVLAQSPASPPGGAMRIIAPYAAGGAVDIVSRLVAQKLTETLGRPVIVDNRPGAGSVVGSELLTRSAPDGNTLMMANIALSANPSLHKRKLPFDVAQWKTTLYQPGQTHKLQKELTQRLKAILD